MKIIKEALKEDIGNGDVTTDAIVPKSVKARAVIIAKERGVIAGLDIAKAVFLELDKNLSFNKKVNDGDSVAKGGTIAVLEGNARAILTGERVALNFLQRLSGIATLTREFVNLAGNAKILDTRKTTPCLRKLERYAVRMGEGTNHRFNLNDAVLIKDNHIMIAGSIKEAMKRARKTGKRIEVEVTNIDEVKEALDANADVIMFDNMPARELRNAIKLAKGRAKIEVSGGVNLENVKNIAKTGVDYISIGALTHSAKALDISLELVKAL